MKPDAMVLAARPALVFFSPRKRVSPRRVPITLWQTHSWIKKIIKIPKRSGVRQETKTMRPRAK